MDRIRNEDIRVTFNLEARLERRWWMHWTKDAEDRCFQAGGHADGWREEDARDRVKWMQVICCEKLSFSVLLQVELTCYNVSNLPLQMIRKNKEGGFQFFLSLCKAVFPACSFRVTDFKLTTKSSKY